MSAKAITLDVREGLRHGRAPFEPAPLDSALASQDCDHESTQIPSGDWEVLFPRRRGETSAFVQPRRPFAGLGDF